MLDTPGLENKTRTAALSIDRPIRFAFGFQHDLRNALTLSASFVYVNLGKGKL